MQANFFSAAHSCVHLDMKLASIESKEENDAVVNHIKKLGKESFL